MFPPLEPESGRRTPAKGVHIQTNGPTLVFLTVATHQGERWLDNTRSHQSLHRVWQNDARAWQVGDCLLMPDHVHLFCAPFEGTVSIDRWVAYWKDRLAKGYPEAQRWQRSSFHHRLRSRSEFDEKWAYMRENPVRKGWVIQSDDWPYQGKVFPVGW